MVSGIHGTKVDNQAMAAYVSEGCTDGASAAAYTHTSLVSMHVANQAYMSRKERPKGPEALLTTFEPLAWKNAKPAKLSCGAQSNTINCMGVAVPNVYLGGVSLIVRSSEDHAFHGVGKEIEQATSEGAAQSESRLSFRVNGFGQVVASKIALRFHSAVSRCQCSGLLQTERPTWM